MERDDHAMHGGRRHAKEQEVAFRWRAAEQGRVGVDKRQVLPCVAVNVIDMPCVL
jgi:hypothetical protein